MSGEPRVELSVVIPTCDRYHQLARGVRALARQLAAGALPGAVEVLVVDDGSAPEVVRRKRQLVAGLDQPAVRLLALPENRGASVARNVGAEASRGAVVAFLDDDLVPARGYLAAVLGSHARHPEAMVINGNLRALADDVYSRFWFYYYDAAFNRPGERFHTVEMLASGHCSMKRELLELERPLFDASLTSREDYDLFLRLSGRGIRVYKDDDILAFNDCRSSLMAFVRQRLWYDRGQAQLVAKHGPEQLALHRGPPRPPPSLRFLHLHLLLRLARALVGARAHLQRLRARTVGGGPSG